MASNRKDLKKQASICATAMITGASFAPHFASLIEWWARLLSVHVLFSACCLACIGTALILVAPLLDAWEHQEYEEYEETITSHIGITMGYVVRLCILDAHRGSEHVAVGLCIALATILVLAAAMRLEKIYGRPIGSPVVFLLFVGYRATQRSALPYAAAIFRLSQRTVSGK